MMAKTLIVAAAAASAMLLGGAVPASSQTPGAEVRTWSGEVYQLADRRHLVGDVDGEADHREQKDHEAERQEDRGPPLFPQHLSKHDRAPPFFHHRVNRTVSMCCHGTSTRPWAVRPLRNVVPRLT